MMMGKIDDTDERDGLFGAGKWGVLGRCKADTAQRILAQYSTGCGV